MKKVRFEHDNVRPNDARTSMSQLSMFEQIVLLQYTYSPGFALFEYWLFGELRRDLGERGPTTPDMFEAAFQQFFESRPVGWYKHGIHKLPERWREVIDNYGHYLQTLSLLVLEKYVHIGKPKKSSET